MSLFTKEKLWAIRSCRSLQKIDCEWFVRDSRDSLAKKERSARKIYNFLCFWQFSPFGMPMSELLPWLFAHSLSFKERLEQFAQVAHAKRATGVIRSGRSWQKSDLEQFTHIALYKRTTGANHSFSRTNHSFAHKKRANSQPCRLRLNSWEQQTFVFMKCTPKQKGQNTFLSNNILILCHRPILIEVTLFRNFFNIIIYPPLDYQKENKTSA